MQVVLIFISVLLVTLESEKKFFVVAEFQNQGNVKVKLNRSTKEAKLEKYKIRIESGGVKEGDEVYMLYLTYPVKPEISVEVEGKGKIKARFPENCKVKFAVLGDTSTVTGVLPSLVKIITEFSPHFVFHTGDLQYSTSYDRWSKLFETLRPIFEMSFFQPVPGNHEYEFVTGWGRYRFDRREFEDFFLRFFPHGGFFKIRVCSVVFAGINSEEVERTLEVVEGWDEKYPKIVFVHRPPVSFAHRRELSPKIFDSLLQKNTRVIFAGHDHLYARGKFKGITLVTTGGGGGGTYPCDTKKAERFGFFCKSVYHVVLCSLDCSRECKLNCRAIDRGGQEIDRFSVPFP